MTTRPKPYLYMAKPVSGDLPDDIRRWPNHVLMGRNNRFYWKGLGSLSLKMFFNGAAHYQVGRRGHCVVDEDSYLLLNHDQEYTITIESPTVVNSFCVFFAEGFAGEVYRSQTERTENLLDNPVTGTSPFHFFERTYPHDQRLSPLLHTIRRTLLGEPDLSPTWLEEQMHPLMEGLLFQHQHTRSEADALGWARPATREELYRRLYTARDYITAMSEHSLTIESVAQVACLSTNHFLRTFKTVFHQTPHQYLTECRLASARRLLERTDLPVTEVCLQVGFVSLGSFSSLFTRRIGVSPEKYRRRFR